MPRIRLQACSPLPALKAWFLVPNNITNIRDLKFTLCSQLSSLKDMHLQPPQLILEMDDFEILDESPVDLVREADVVMLKKRDVVTTVAQAVKRKFDAENSISMEKKRRKLSVLSISTSSGTSSSSDSDSSTSSSSSSDTDSDSNSSSYSAPSATETREKQPSNTLMTPIVANRHTGRTVLLAEVRQMAQQTDVPPGCGKPSTQARNRRRKIKRKFAAGKDIPGTSSVPVFILDPTDHKADTSSPVLSYDYLVPESAQASLASATPPISLSGLGNSNKRKGFKKSMEGILPQKLVFDSSTIPSFIPPSERKMLPHNILVTSVDVEWRTGRGRWEDVEETEAEPVLENEHRQPADEEQEARRSIDWTSVETGWEKYPKIEATTDILSGSIVGWRCFGIDPRTLTPQASLLHLGRVVTRDTETLTVSPLVRPGIGPATFGRAQINEVEDKPVEELSTPITEILSGDWRVVSNK